MKSSTPLLLLPPLLSQSLLLLFDGWGGGGIVFVSARHTCRYCSGSSGNTVGANGECTYGDVICDVAAVEPGVGGEPDTVVCFDCPPTRREIDYNTCVDIQETSFFCQKACILG